MPENQSSNTALATLHLHHQKSRYELSSITSITSSNWNVFQMVAKISVGLRSLYSKQLQSTLTLIISYGSHKFVVALVPQVQEYVEKWQWASQTLGGVSCTLLNQGGSNMISPPAMMRIKLVSWWTDYSFPPHTLENTSFYMTIIYILQLQHKKPGYKSPVTALYLPFSLKLWMAVISAIFVSLCFTLTYANTHPEPELSVYNLAILTFASIFEESHMASLSSLHSNTIRYCIFIQ